MKHDLYKDGDQDIPEQITDRNGQVALAMCKWCRQAEIQLEPECPAVLGNIRPIVRGQDFGP